MTGGGGLETANGLYGALSWTHDGAGNRLSENRNGSVTNYYKRKKRKKVLDNRRRLAYQNTTYA